MTTATKTRPKADVLAELADREERWADAKADAGRLGTEFGEKFQRAQALASERQRLVYREPGLVDHQGNPNPAVKDNPAVAIDKQLTELGDLADLKARMDHARSLANRAMQATHDYTAAHLDEILHELAPDAEAVRAEVVRAMGELAAAASAYLALAGRVNALKGTVRERQRQHVPAYDVGSDLLKLSQDYEPPPLPTEMR